MGPLLLLCSPLLLMVAAHYATRPFPRIRGVLFVWACGVCTWICAIVLFGLLAGIVIKGAPLLSFRFLTSLPDSDAAEAGIWVPLIGTLWLMALTALFSIPLGVGTALYLEEFAKDSWWKRIVEINISNLAGVPSIVYGMLGLAIFCRSIRLGPDEPIKLGLGLEIGPIDIGLGLENAVLAGALTLTIVVLPVVILASQEAFRSVPDSLRHASLGLGATRWQTVWRQVLPSASPGVTTGVILALSRALGETAPLIAAGAVAYVADPPQTLMDPYSALPLQIYEWAGDAKKDLQALAAPGILVLLFILVCVNLTATAVRIYQGSQRT